MTDLIGRRCSKGCRTWPDDATYSECAFCGDPTRRFRGLTPLTEEAAQSAVRHAEFDHFYEEEWPQDTTPLTDEDLLEMGIDVHKQALPEAPVRPVPGGQIPARIPRSPFRSGRPASSASSAS